MRILHTSDWHLGKTLHGLDLIEYQRAFVDELLAIVEDQRIDCVILAGDVFDKALPSVDAVSLFSGGLTRIADKCAVVVTSGNHDSAIRLGAGSALYRAGVHVVTEPTAACDQLDLQVGDVRLRIYPIPYLDPDHCRSIFGGEEPLARSHAAVMGAAIERIWEHDKTLAIEPHARIAVAHAFVTGGERSDSERDISVGGVDAIPAEIFAGFDYVALGHLHRPQCVAADMPIRYSGSPLRYSFSEESQRKSVYVVDVDTSGVRSVQAIELVQPRGMITLTGTFEEISHPQTVTAHADSWARIVVNDAKRPERLVERMKELFPFALSIVHEPSGAIPKQTIGPRTVDLRDPVTVAADFVDAVTSAPPSEDELIVLRDAYEIARLNT